MSVKEVVLNFTEGENEGVEIKLTPPRVIRIGRSEESDIFLGEKKISRKHCILHLGEEALSISDLESTNGTFVNSKRIHEQLLENGDRVRIGSSILEVSISLLGTSQEASTAAKIKPEANIPKVNRTEDIELNFDDVSGQQPAASELSKTVNISEMTRNQQIDDPDMVVEYHDSSLEVPAPSGSPSQELEFEDFQIEATTGGVQVPQEVAMDPTVLPMTSDEFTLDKIPEIQEIAEVMVSDVEFISEISSEPPPTATPKKKNKPLSGDFSAMGLADLLQNLHQNQKTGRLSIVSDDFNGEILIRSGRVYSAQVGKAVASKAIYRMLGWEEGDFEFKPLDDQASDFTAKGVPAMQDSIDGLLMEGMRQLDEINKIRDVLPKMSSTLSLNPNSDVPLSKLLPKVLDVVQLTMVHQKMSDVMDLSPLNDLETAKIIFYLVKKDMIKVS